MQHKSSADTHWKNPRCPDCVIQEHREITKACIAGQDFDSVPLLTQKVIYDDANAPPVPISLLGRCSLPIDRLVTLFVVIGGHRRPELRICSGWQKTRALFARELEGERVQAHQKERGNKIHAKKIKQNYMPAAPHKHKPTFKSGPLNFQVRKYANVVAPLAMQAKVTC